MKNVFAIIVLFFLSTTGSAQGVHIGAKVGANLSDASGKSFQSGFHFGYHAGIFSELMLTKKFGLAPEVLFSETNLRAGNSFSSLYSTVSLANVSDIKLHYLSIPVLLAYKPIPFITFHAGPQFGVLMNQTRTLVANGTDAFKKGDISVLAGAQLNVLKFRVYARYVVGLSNLNDIDNRDKWRSQSLQAGVGFTL